MSDTFDLKEGTDFIVIISYNQNNDVQANVKCCCGHVGEVSEGFELFTEQFI